MWNTGFVPGSRSVFSLCWGMTTKVPRSFKNVNQLALGEFPARFVATVRKILDMMLLLVSSKVKGKKTDTQRKNLFHFKYFPA